MLNKLRNMLILHFPPWGRWIVSAESNCSDQNPKIFSTHKVLTDYSRGLFNLVTADLFVDHQSGRAATADF